MLLQFLCLFISIGVCLQCFVNICNKISLKTFPGTLHILNNRPTYIVLNLAFILPGNRQTEGDPGEETRSMKTGKEQGEETVNFLNLCFSSNNQKPKIFLLRKNVSMQTV